MNRQEDTEELQGQKKQPKKKELVLVFADKAMFKEVVPEVSKVVV